MRLSISEFYNIIVNLECDMQNAVDAAFHRLYVSVYLWSTKVTVIPILHRLILLVDCPYIVADLALFRMLSYHQTAMTAGLDVD